MIPVFRLNLVSHRMRELSVLSSMGHCAKGMVQETWQQRAEYFLKGRSAETEVAVVGWCRGPAASSLVTQGVILGGAISDMVKDNSTSIAGYVMLLSTVPNCKDIAVALFPCPLYSNTTFKSQS